MHTREWAQQACNKGPPDNVDRETQKLHDRVNQGTCYPLKLSCRNDRER